MDQLLGLRHPLPRGRATTAASTARGPHARGAPRAGHRRAHAPRGAGDRPGRRRGRGARPARRRRRTASASTSCSSPPGARRSARTCPASTCRSSTACRPSTTPQAPARHAGGRPGCRRSWSSAAATSAWRWPRPSSSGGARRPSSSRPPQPMGDARPDMGALVADGAARPRHRRALRGRGRRASSRATVLDRRRTGRRRPRRARASASAPTRRWPPTPGSSSGAKGADPRRRAPAHHGAGRVGGRRLRRVHATWSPGGPSTSPLGTYANKQGRVAGINIGGGYATFPGRPRHRHHQGLRHSRSPAPG